ncbi:hypothetical protein AAFF_G00273420 [Aldrovandia affinis]|uniref:Uncharacterized protein n=1 Tax=Aldrovandia affinis TaxID=143900 RepID=A0AAD7SRV6_9TELE|nr:hypothetical protein AAFF_G00273420 [Aldrovandia affinis]
MSSHTVRLSLGTSLSLSLSPGIAKVSPLTSVTHRHSALALLRVAFLGSPGREDYTNTPSCLRTSSLSHNKARDESDHRSHVSPGHGVWGSCASTDHSVHSPAGPTATSSSSRSQSRGNSRVGAKDFGTVRPDAPTCKGCCGPTPKASAECPQQALPPGIPLETPPQVDPLGTNQQQGVSVQPGLIGDLPVQPITQAPQPGAEVFVPAMPNEQETQAGPPVLMPVQPNTWVPQPGVPFLVPLPPNTQGTLPTDQPGLPQMFPPYGFLPVFPSQTGNQQFPGYGLPLFFPTGFSPQLPGQPTDTAQTAQPSLPVLPGQPAQPTQPGQQQIPQIFYMIRQPTAGPFGSASSEESQGAGTMGGFGMFLPGFGGGVPSAGVNSAIPGGLPAGQGVDPAIGADPVPPTAAVLPVGLEIPLDKDPAGGLVAGKPTDHSNPGLTAGSEPKSTALP